MNELDLLSEQIERLLAHIDQAYEFHSKEQNTTLTHNAEKFLGLYRYYESSELKSFKNQNVVLDDDKLFVVDVCNERFLQINENLSMNPEILVIDIYRVYGIIKEVYFN